MILETIKLITRTLRQLLSLRRSSARGQAAVEYVIVLGTLIAAITILVVFLIAFREYGERSLELAGSEYP